jgi:hypothetical protein
MAQCNESCEHKAKSDRRIALLADRLAITLVLLKQRHGDDWDPWFGEGMWEDEGAMGDVIREFSEYQTAVKIVRLFLQRQEKKQ